ncbi:hypothetical protein EI94DRAFT_1703981 [Lactarius quietus]|nr:hypothetical protein EI94DRAFT_1703981 [Lactarius quietus]
MPKKPVKELTKNELKLLRYWDDNICEELGDTPLPSHPADNGTQWGSAEKAGTPLDWTGLTLKAHQDLFTHDLMPYLRDIPPKKQWWNFPPPAAPNEDVNMEDSPRDPSPAPPLPPIPPASQKHTVKGKAWAAPPPPPPDEYGPPQTHRTRARKHSTVLPDSDGPADMPSKGEVDKDTPMCPVLPQGLHMWMWKALPPHASKAPCKESMKAYGMTDVVPARRKGLTVQISDVWKKLPCAPPPLWAHSVYEVANTRAPDKPPEYRGIPEHLESLEHEIAQLKQLLLAICSKLGVDVSTIPGLALSQDVLLIVCIVQAAKEKASP